MNIIYIFSIAMLILLIHELGHVLAAKIMGLKIESTGINMKPYPHLYVFIKWPLVK